MGLYGNTVKDARNDIVSIVNAAIKDGDIKAGGSGSGAGTAGPTGPAGPKGATGAAGAAGAAGTSFTPTASSGATAAAILTDLKAAGILT